MARARRSQLLIADRLGSGAYVGSVLETGPEEYAGR